MKVALLSNKRAWTEHWVSTGEMLFELVSGAAAKLLVSAVLANGSGARSDNPAVPHKQSTPRADTSSSAHEGKGQVEVTRPQTPTQSQEAQGSQQ